MSYRAPNAYARFVKAATAVNSPGSTRVMGIIGTGLNYYEVYNEAVQKNSDKPYDELANSNVFEIMNVSSKPVVAGKKASDNVTYSESSDFTFDDKYIKWNILSDNGAKVLATPVATDGSAAFFTQIACSVDANYEHFVEDGSFKIEISYIGTSDGTYRIINNDTQELIGEYAISEGSKTNVIPGVKLTIDSTYVKKSDSTDSATSVGDYVVIKTTAAKTETEATFKLTTEVTDATKQQYNISLEDSVKSSMMIVEKSAIVNGKFEIVVTKALTSEMEIRDITNNIVLYTGTIGGQDEFLNVIPGLTFVFDTIYDNAKDGDTVTIITTARVIQLHTDGTDAVPAEGDNYYVSYKYRKADENYEAKIFYDYDDIIEEYGNYDVTAAGLVINSLTLGAEIAFQNGVTPIVCVQAKNDSDFEMKVAIDKLKKVSGINNVNSIVPLTKSPFVGAYAVTHVDDMSSYENGKERMTYLAAYPNQKLSKGMTALDKTVGMIETAQSYSNERVVYVVPGEVIREVRDLRTGKVNDRKVPGCYLAVAVAAIGLTHDPAEPLTYKTIAGFKGLTTILSESEKNMLAGNGCLVLEQIGSTIRVRHGITTSTVDVDSSEITLVQIKDHVIDACRKATAELYIGNKNRPSIVSDVQYTITSILNQFISQDIILSYTNLSVKRSKEDARQIDVKFEIEAVYPLNYINISFGFTALS